MFDDEAKRVQEEWGDANPKHMDKLHPSHRAGFCIPLLVPKSLAFNIFERLTPDMKEKQVVEADGQARSLRLGEDQHGREVHRNRDIWVVSVTDNEGFVRHAEASADALIELLRRRMAHCTISLGAEDLETLSSKFELALRLKGRAQYQEAEALLREVLEGRRKKLGDQHPDTLISICNMGMLLQEMGKLEQAEALLREVLEGRRKNLGDQHPKTLASTNRLGALLEQMGKRQ